MPEFIPLISRKTIQDRVREIGEQITQDYQGKDLILTGILKGAFIFMADLSRQIKTDHEIDFIGASSYEGTHSTGQLVFTKQPDLEFKNRNILLVEDIVDTGITLTRIIDYVHLLNPNSVAVCALIDKYERRKKAIDVKYACFSLKKGFIVGYGLDYDEKYRNKSEIYDLKL